MDDLQELKRRVARLERSLRWAGALVVVLAAAVTIAATQAGQEVLTARGLVITDSDGRERIVIGAPMDEASPDPKLAGTVGLAVLDGEGQLQVAVGTNKPLIMADGRRGPRVGVDAGLTIYDPRDGRERGGMGVFDDGRANVCLDYGTAPKEAACMAVAAGDQYAAVILNGTPGEDVFDRVVMYAGADGTGSIKAFGGKANQGGLLVRAGSGPTSVAVYDSTGTVVADLARMP